MSFLVDILHACRLGLNDDWRETFDAKTVELFGERDEELVTTHAVQAAQALGDFPGCDLFLKIVKKIGMAALIEYTTDPSIVFALIVSERLGAVFTEDQVCDLLCYRYNAFKPLLAELLDEDTDNFGRDINSD